MGFMYDYNNYNEEHRPAEITYYPEDYTKKKKPHIFLKILGGLLFAAVISASSIGGYIALSGDTPKFLASSSSSAQTSSSSSDSSSSSESQSLIKLASKTNALSIPEIVKKVTPSVVGISSVFPSTSSNFNFQGITPSEQTATGTGIIMSQDGYIITNAHVISNSDTGQTASAINVVLNDKTEYPATVIGCDTKTDLAVIKIQATGLTPAEFGDSSALEVGELAVAIGNPLGFELSGSVTAGIISAVDRKITIDDRTMTYIQTDAAINPGNSGGPLLNCYGQVIGINSAKISSSDVEGLGFAIPINSATPIVNDLIKNGYVTGRPLIGLSGEDITEVMAKYYNIPQGVYVRFITSGSSAEAAGIKVGDIIVGINGTTIKTMSELNEIKDKFKPGDKITLTIYRNGKNLDVSVTLAEAKN
jgi:serine protease Do